MFSLFVTQTGRDIHKRGHNCHSKEKKSIDFFSLSRSNSTRGALDSQHLPMSQLVLGSRRGCK